MKRGIPALLSSVIGLLCAGAMLAPAAAKETSTKPSHAEGPVHATELIAGPFDIHRKYRSMEGPFVNQDMPIGDLVASQHVEIPESQVFYVEDYGKPAPTMLAKSESNANTSTELQGVVRKSTPHRELYWFKGIKLEVLDEQNRIMPTAEFICHFNLDVETGKRRKLFRTGERMINARLVSLTQGQTELHFPEGYGVPVASDEIWRFGFQVANRTTDAHRKVKHRCTVYFIKDSELTKPITALHWSVPYCTVVVDRANSEGLTEHAGMSCHPSPDGAVAPNKGADLSVLKDSQGRRLSGHWVVPPGTHEYSSPIEEERDPSFAAQDRTIHAIWTHVHPLCVSTALVECDGATTRDLYTVKIQTKQDGGLQVKHIDTITSKKGIPLASGKHYSLVGTYVNNTGVDQDSMISHGIFFADNEFQKPDWAVTTPSETETEPGLTSAKAATNSVKDTNRTKNAPFCGVTSDGSSCSAKQSKQ